MKKKSPDLPDFELAELNSIEPRLFFASTLPKTSFERCVRELILSLSLIFNDSKDLSWWLCQIEKGRPAISTAVTPYRGNFNGMHVHIMRLLLSLFHESLELLDTYNKTITDPKFSPYTANLSGAAKLRWDDAVSLISTWKDARGKRTPFKTFLHHIRSKAAFHYDGRALLLSYEKFFSRQSSPNKHFAYASLGSTLEETRLFFADAAAQQIINDEFRGQSISIKEINSYWRTMNEPLKVIIETFIDLETEVVEDDL